MNNKNNSPKKLFTCESKKLTMCVVSVNSQNQV